jgi:hypothetical protein
MDPWPFVIGAYALTALGTAGVVAYSFLAMRKAEGKADKL